jgi:hypothetical protein
LNIKSHGVYSFVYYYCIFVKQNIQTKHYDCNSRDDISQLEKVERLNLINSCTGYKSANLIATKSVDGAVNVAIFSSITHLEVILR